MTFHAITDLFHRPTARKARGPPTMMLTVANPKQPSTVGPNLAAAGMSVPRVSNTRQAGSRYLAATSGRSECCDENTPALASAPVVPTHEFIRMLRQGAWQRERSILFCGRHMRAIPGTK